MQAAVSISKRVMGREGTENLPPEDKYLLDDGTRLGNMTVKTFYMAHFL